MAVFKCKMCGAALEVQENLTTTTCEYCGSQQTLPKLNDDKVERLYDRANHFRRNNDFDKAMGIYEQILDENGEDAESYWSLVLCRYGIEYVEDPMSHKRIPTVNRVQYTSIFDDDNYKCALMYADISQKTIYEQEATVINQIQKGILEISQKEEPFDVFICYKETDETGRRTHDSVYATELYHELTREGFKVFFARITLEDKLGIAYEPYIFAALNSAKVMVVLGTNKEYFNAVWVKNEWSRYLALIKSGEKKVLIPAYKDMDPYDLPQEFSHLQAQDMNKLGFMPDLVRGIKKIVGAQTPAPQPTYAPQPAAPQIAANQRYNVRLTTVPDRKLACIKVVRETFGLGLSEAKNLVEGNRILAKNVPIYEAEEIQSIFQNEGFDVTVEAVGGGAYTPVPTRVNAAAPAADVTTLLKRVVLFLEGCDWNSADAYCEKVLDIDPETPTAYIYKLMAQLHVSQEEDLAKSDILLETRMPYKNALRFADEATAKRLIEYNRVVKEELERRERERQEQIRLEQERKEAELREQKRRREEEEQARLAAARKRQEIDQLRTKKSQLESTLTAVAKEQDDLKQFIQKTEGAIEALSKNAKKAKIFAALVMANWIAALLSLIVGLVAGELGGDDVISTCIFIGVSCLILFIVFSICMFKANHNKAALVWINLCTYGVFSLIYSLVVLIRNPKKKIMEYKMEINSSTKKIRQCDQQMLADRALLEEISQKLEMLTADR